MQLDPVLDRLVEPKPVRRRTKKRSAAGAWAISIVACVLLIVLGFVIAIAGVLAGFISQGQLLALFNGADPTVAPRQASAPVVAVDSATPAAEAKPAAKAAPPATPQAHVVRDEAFGDWRFVCVAPSDGAPKDTPPICSASQQLRVAETGAAVFVWRIVQDGKGGLVGLWQVPETVLLAAGLTLDAGTPKPVVMPFASCGDGSCKVAANLAPDFIKSLSGADKLSASVVLTSGQKVSFPLSAKGLDDALAALSK